MNYWLHPAAQEDLREAARFYRETAGTDLSQSLLSEFEYSVSLLLDYPGLGAIWRSGKRRLVMRAPSIPSAQFQQQFLYRRRDCGARGVLHLQPDPARGFGEREDFAYRTADRSYPQFEMREAMLDLRQAECLLHLAAQDIAAKHFRQT